MYNLNDEQKNALEKIKMFLEGEDKFFLLQGYAGTGKTYVLSALIADITRQKRMWIALTAPTNKAVKVAEKASKKWGNHNIEYMTTYQLLGLSMDIDENGDRILIEGKDSCIGDFDLILIDEASMIPSNLWNLLVQISRKYRRIKMIFVGDHAQLNPVNELESPVFSQIDNKAELTEIMRTDKDNPVMVAISSAREKVYNPSYPLPILTQFNENMSNGVWYLNDSQFNENMIKAFLSDKYKQDPDYVRAIAWTNQRVDALNRIIRQALYPNTYEPYVIGERIIAKDAIMDDLGEVKISTNTEMIVTKTKYYPSVGKGSYNHWVLEVETDNRDIQYIEVLDISSANQLKKDLKGLAELAINSDKNHAKAEWRKYWRLKSKFANVGYAYALTSHKAQGSTFKNVFVEQSNIMRNPNATERYRALYVCYSRVSDRLFIHC